MRALESAPRPSAAKPSACSTSLRQDEGPRVTVRPRRDAGQRVPKLIRRRSISSKKSCRHVSTGQRGNAERVLRGALAGMAAGELDRPG